MFEHPCSPRHYFRKGLAIVILVPAAIAALGFIVMSLWNGLLPPIFGIKTIHFWQAIGLLLLARILFGGFHHRHGRCGSHRHRMHMLERWERMTPEERERFRKGLHRCGCSHEEPQAKV